ncbi:uncharacterized protein [Nothobranchius furzeri]|uniref:uncharacterized protein isoform X2 n=1 Tax=Nothobranchius furzeri TaxID=105023 RepID=UPI0039046DB6
MKLASWQMVRQQPSTCTLRMHMVFVTCLEVYEDREVFRRRMALLSFVGRMSFKETQINELISAMMLPSKPAIVKCPAHRKGNCDIIRDNNAADETAKSASRCEEAIMTPVISLEPVITPEYIILIQEKAEKSEQQWWRKRGATMDSSSLWRSHEGLIDATSSAQRKGSSLEQLELELKGYIKQLTIKPFICRKELVSSIGADRPVVPGDQVYIKVFRRKWHKPQREGPYKVVRATPTAVQVERGLT